MLKQLCLTLLVAVFASPAMSFQSDWVEVEGAAMRLVISDDSTTSARGFLEIKLSDGWKTYWRDPGEGGIPPTLSGDGTDVELLFPAPERINENGQVFSGYHTGVSLPFVLPEILADAEKLTAFIGVCSEICVPFQAEFPLVRSKMHADLVNSAFSKLPKPAGAGEGILDFTRNADSLRLSVIENDASLFLAPGRGLYFATPEVNSTGFSVKILKEKTPGVKVHYTLKTTDGAVSGSFEMPQ